MNDTTNTAHDIVPNETGITTSKKHGLSPTAKSIALIVAAYAVEFYDFVLYGIFAAIVGRQFFPSTEPALELLGAAGAFAVGFIARPIGGILTGILADRIGRRRALTLNLFLMGFASVAIALIPPFAWIGIAAPLLVILCRILQGFSAGGNATSALTMLIEYGGEKHRGLFGAFAQVGNFVGTFVGGMMGALLSASLSAEAMSGWGWRVAFIVGALVVPLGVVIARSAEETLSTVMVGARSSGAAEARMPKISDDYRKLIWATLLMVSPGMCAFYTLFYLPGHGSVSLNLPTETGYQAIIVACVIGIGSALLSGALSDCIGRRRVFLFSLAGFAAVLVAGTHWLVRDPTASHMLVVVGLLAIVFAPQVNVGQTWITESFPQAVRGTGVGIVINVGGVILAGSTPFVAAWLTRISGTITTSVWFVVCGVLISFLAATQLKDASRNRIPDRYK